MGSFGVLLSFSDSVLIGNWLAWDLCRPGWPHTCLPTSSQPPVSASPMLGLQACDSVPYLGVCVCVMYKYMFLERTISGVILRYTICLLSNRDSDWLEAC